MNIFETLNSYGNLINTALLVGMFGLLAKIAAIALKYKNTEAESLRAHIELLRDSTVVDFNLQIKEWKKYYEENMKIWYENSLSELEKNKENAIKEKEVELQEKLQKEIEKRKKIMEATAETSPNSFEFTKSLSEGDVIGTYNVVGNNPPPGNHTYFGVLKIQKELDAFVGEWIIGERQKIKGTGILQNGVLSFICTDRDGEYPSIVSYIFVTPKVMRGDWITSGDFSMGFEECRKLESSENET